MDDISESKLATPDNAKPVAPASGRIASLDFIRGIAVLGILAANIFAMGQPFTAYMYPEAFTTGHSQSEDWMWAAQLVLIDGKMRQNLEETGMGYGLEVDMIRTVHDLGLLTTPYCFNPEEAAAGTIRADFAESLAKNAIHGSDSDENAKIEADFHFSAEERF